MAQEIGDGGAVLQGGVVDLEGRSSILDKCLLVGFFFLHQYADGGCRDSFRHGANR